MKYFFEENKKNPSYPAEFFHDMVKYRNNASEVDFKNV